MTIEQVRSLLQRFQDGYTKRDQDLLDAFMELFIEGDELEVIGTNAVETGKEEWCIGRPAVRVLVSRDWEHWGNVVYDVNGAHIHVNGNTAWLATTGTVTDTITREDRYEGYLAYVKDVLEERVTPQQKMLEIVRLGSEMVTALPLDETFIWPFRFTAVAVKVNGKWKFHQVQFSFATTRSPDVRIA